MKFRSLTTGLSARAAAFYAAAVTLFTAIVLAVSAAAPALAHGDEEKIDTLEPYLHTNDPMNWIAIAIVMVVVLGVVLVTSTLVGNLFTNKNRGK